jgi:hypothetical protein
MDTAQPTLILSSRYTEDSRLLWQAAIRRGWRVERIHGWRIPDHLRAVTSPILYLEALFAPMLAAEFGLILNEPPDDWLPRLPLEYRRREVRLTTLAHARQLSAPAFIKPPNDKQFPAAVYEPVNLPDLPDETPVLVADIVSWASEYRCFILDRQLMTTSIYLRDGELQRANDFRATEAEHADMTTFVQTVLADKRVDLPSAVVLDVGIIRDQGWAVVELNAAWGAGLYGCNPDRALDVIRQAAVPL